MTVPGSIALRMRSRIRRYSPLYRSLSLVLQSGALRTRPAGCGFRSPLSKEGRGLVAQEVAVGHGLLPQLCFPLRVRAALATPYPPRWKIEEPKIARRRLGREEEEVLGRSVPGHRRFCGGVSALPYEWKASRLRQNESGRLQLHTRGKPAGERKPLTERTGDIVTSSSDEEGVRQGPRACRRCRRPRQRKEIPRSPP